MDATIGTSNEILFQKIIAFLDEEFDNFQQAWQENTEDDIHRIEVEKKHQHIHIKFEKQESSFNTSLCTNFILNNYRGRSHPKLINQHVLSFLYNKEKDTIHSSFSELPLDQLQESETEEILWTQKQSFIIGRSENTSIQIIGNQLIISQKEGFYSNPLPYKFIKCRFFSGWIEYPNQKNPEEVYRMGNLKMHDQGDMIPLTFEDNTKGIYTVELTQLIFGKTLPIMKLGIYEEPIDDIHYNSKAMSYTWTNPEAKRIGLNLRKVLTGWTFIEPGYVSSNNMDLE